VVHVATTGLSAAKQSNICESRIFCFLILVVDTEQQVAIQVQCCSASVGVHTTPIPHRPGLMVVIRKAIEKFFYLGRKSKKKSPFICPGLKNKHNNHDVTFKGGCCDIKATS